MNRADLIFVNETLRYPRPARPSEAEMDGFKNFFHATAASPTLTRVQLERGNNGVAVTDPAGQRRRPAVLIRSSPWKAGTTQTPWHERFDLENHRVIYYGDQKVEHLGPLGSTAGNKLLEEVWALHRSEALEDRLAAPPLVVFRAVPWKDTSGKLRDKGAVEFVGVAVLEALAPVSNVDPDTGTEFANYQADLRLLELDGSPQHLRWSWINARRSNADLDDVLRSAPRSWQMWARGH